MGPPAACWPGQLLCPSFPFETLFCPPWQDIDAPSQPLPVLAVACHLVILHIFTVARLLTSPLPLRLFSQRRNVVLFGFGSFLGCRRLALWSGPIAVVFLNSRVPVLALFRSRVWGFFPQKKGTCVSPHKTSVAFSVVGAFSFSFPRLPGF